MDRRLTADGRLSAVGKAFLKTDGRMSTWRRPSSVADGRLSTWRKPSSVADGRLSTWRKPSSVADGRLSTWKKRFPRMRKHSPPAMEHAVIAEKGRENRRDAEHAEGAF
jgi:hypothetical protein